MALVKAEFRGLTQAMERARQIALRELTDRAGELMLEPTAHFQNHGVGIKTEENKAGVLVILDSDIAEGAHVPLVYLLSAGTSVRRAVLSADWMSQTSPDSLSSRPGAGTELLVGKSINEPGILPRNWDRLAAEELRKEAVAIVAEVYARNLPR